MSASTRLVSALLLIGISWTLIADRAVAADPNASASAAMSEQSLPYVESQPLALPDVPDAVRTANKQLVLDFYRLVLQKQDFRDESVGRYLAPQFHNHDPVEPGTAAGYAAFWRALLDISKRNHTGPPFSGDGTPKDAAGSPVQTLIADGDLVVVIRRRDYPWPEGQAGVYRSYFADIWRVQDGRIVDQWCTCLASDYQGNVRATMEAARKASHTDDLTGR